MTVVGDVKSRVMVADACAAQMPKNCWMHLLMRAQKLPDGCSASRVPVQVGDDLMKYIQALVLRKIHAAGRLCGRAGTPSEQCRALVRRVACCHGDQGISKGVDVLGP